MQNIVVNAEARKVVNSLRTRGFKFVKEDVNSLNEKSYLLEKNEVPYRLEKNLFETFNLVCCSKEMGEYPLDIDRVLGKIKSPKDFILEEAEMMENEFPELDFEKITELVHDAAAKVGSDYRNWMEADRFDYLYEYIDRYVKINTQLIVEFKYKNDSLLANDEEENEKFAEKKNYFYDLMKMLSKAYNIKHQGAFTFTMPPCVWNTIKEVFEDTCFCQNGIIEETEIIGEFNWSKYFKK